MKYLKDLEMDTLEINELQDYADMKEVDLDKEINDILNTGVRNLYKKLVPKERQALIERKISKTKKPTPKKEEKKAQPIKQEEKSVEPVKKEGTVLESKPKVEQKQEIKQDFVTGLFR